MPPLGYGRNSVISDGFVRGFTVPYCFIFTENMGSGNLRRNMFSKNTGVQAELEYISDSEGFNGRKRQGESHKYEL